MTKWLTSRCSSHASRAGQFLIRGSVVLLRKSVPQNHNLKTAAELGVMHKGVKLLECPYCKNYEPNDCFKATIDQSYFECKNCKCRFNLSPNAKIHIIHKPIPHVIFVCMAIACAFVSAVLGKKILFWLFLDLAFFINIYFPLKIKVVYDVAKLCLLSKDFTVSEYIWAFGSILLNVFGFIFFSFYILKWLIQ